MAIIFDYTADNGAKGNYFRIMRIEGVVAPNTIDPRWEVWVGMYASQDIRNMPNSAPMLSFRINIPFSALAADPRQGATPNFYDLIKGYAPFAGQAVTDVVDDSGDLTLDAAKAVKINEINSARLAANQNTFPYQGKSISCDALSRSDIDGMNGYVTLTGALPANWGGQWKAADNTYVPVATLDDWKAFYGAMVAQGQANFSHAQALKQMVNNATTVNDVRSIDWNTATPGA